ncbi:hypothetical protein BDY19DRAFT_884437 [Irpex rosettiformis]|uniref:Uncharacterized protein n=1 Tax=Irpex rosettiformis TaxID=378272 RepID=A0ACB8UC87_9APHY|nr:hypothetical protein BDY19DRAFT_884437 [Irpex rosettiformis]
MSSTGYVAPPYPASYGTQQQQYAQATATPAQYPAQYPQAQQAYYSAPYPSANIPLKSQSPPPELPTAPEVLDVTPEVASKSIQKLILFGLKEVGFDAAEPQALQRLEAEVSTFISKIFQVAHDSSNLANRAKPIMTDLILGCEDIGYDAICLHRVEVATRKRRREHGREMDVVSQLLAPPSRSPSPELLSSDDEGTSAMIPATLRSHPYYLPPLPPKHTYLRTPIAPPKKAALPSLEKKLKTSSLVQESLKHLLESTEDTPEDNGDGEILGAVVNWEVTNYKRKRWKVGSQH